MALGKRKTETQQLWVATTELPRSPGIRRGSGEDWQAYVTRLMRADGVIAADEQPSEEQIRRFDKQRKGKRVAAAPKQHAASGCSGCAANAWSAVLRTSARRAERGGVG